MSFNSSTRHRAILAEFVYVGFQQGGPVAGTQIPLLLCDSDTPLTIGGQSYLSEPDLKVDIPEYLVDFNNQSARVTFRDVYEVFRQMIGDRAFPSVDCQIREVSWDPRDPIAEDLCDYRYLWRGKVLAGTINSDSKEGLVELLIDECGGRVDLDTTVAVYEKCWKEFGDLKTCGFDKTALEETVSITNINGLELTITGATTPRQLYWDQGNLRVHGTDIKIREWRIDSPTRFVISKHIPFTAVDLGTPLDAILTPGCSRLTSDCTFYQGDTLNFGTLGVKMPGRHPMFERTDD